MKKPKWIPLVILQLIKIYLSAILVFFLFRLILFLTELHRIQDATDTGDILLAFIMGIRFDTVITGYILLLPFIVLTILSLFTKKPAFVTTLIHYYILILFSLAFLVCAIDIPYFNQFFSRFSITAFEWMDSPVFVFRMIIQEPRYWLIIIPFLLLLYAFIRIIQRILRSSSGFASENTWVKLGLSFLFLGLMLAGIRGRIEAKSPIRIGTAYFSQNAFLNQLGLNPNFTLIRSYLDSRKEENQRIRLMEDEVAVANVRRYLGIGNPDPADPLKRRITFDSLTATNYNVVLIIMESMSAAKMKRHGNPHRLTPFLDSISGKGYYFENAYTAGIHTMNGVFSTLFSFPALFRQHPMKDIGMTGYHGLFSTLKEKGYATLYFTTHDGQFDNIEGFLRANGCETVVSKEDYPGDKVKTTLGVPDDFMFEFSIPLLTDLYQQNKPFVAAFMTASDHGPFYIPGYFTPKTSDIRDQIVEYADYSLEKFITLSSAQPWFNQTLFVFIADHGAPIDGLYDMSIDYNHSPLLFYAPAIITEPHSFSGMAGQIDIFPSIMGLLKMPYDNYTLGIDLFRESRPWIFFNADDKYGVIGNEWFLIVRTDGSKSLYKYRDKDTRNYAGEKSEVVDQMDLYAKSNLQVFQSIIGK